MKKVLNYLALALLVLALPFGFLACGSKDVVGTWKYAGIEIEAKAGVELTEEDKAGMDIAKGFAALMFKDMTVEFKSDKTGTVSGMPGDAMFGEEDEDTEDVQEFTWEKKGKKIVITAGEGEDTEEITVTLSKGKIYMSGDDFADEYESEEETEESPYTIKIVFEKVK